MPGRARMGCGILLGAVIAFPAGMMFAGREKPAQDRTASAERSWTHEPVIRNFYSPKIASDPYVLDQQRQVVEGLELQCRQYRENCAEAAQARRWLDEHGSRD